jgi:hypothetical protein
MIEHMIPGRMRMRFRSRRGEEAFFAQLVARLEDHPDVIRVIANPLTASLLVFHTGDPREIAELAGIRACTGCARAQAPANPRAVARLQSLALSALGILQLARGRVLDGASQHLWHAARARQLNMPALALGLMGLGIAQGMRGRYLSSACSLFMNAIMAQAGWPADRPGSGRRAGLRASRFLRHRSTMRRKAKTPIAH